MHQKKRKEKEKEVNLHSSISTNFSQYEEIKKKFESKSNKEIKEAKDYKQRKLEQSRAEAKNTLKNYEAQQREKLEREKDKINVEKNNFNKYYLNEIIQMFFKIIRIKLNLNSLCIILEYIININIIILYFFF